MAYDGGFQSQQRPYAGPAAQRPSPGPGPGPYQQPPPQRQFDGPQQYDGYQDDRGYGYYDDGGYGGDYGGQYQDAGYGRGPPPNQGYPQDNYGPGPNGPGRGRAMPPGGRGGPMPRPPMADPRDGPYPPRGGIPPGPDRGYGNGPPGRGGRPGPGGYDRSGSLDSGSNRGPMNESGRSPVDAGFGGPGPFQAFPGQRRPDFDGGDQMANRMAGLDISQRPRMPMGRGSGGSQRGGMRSPEGDYGRPPMDGPRISPGGPSQGYGDPRRGPDPGYGPPRPNEYGPQYRDDGYGPGPQGRPRDDFGPPSRSMTMPVNDGMQGPRNPMPPPRMDSMPYNGPGRGMPPRPSTAQANRQPPQRMHPPNQGPQGPYGGPDFDGPQNYAQRTRASFDNAYDNAYGPSRLSNPEYGPTVPPEGPDFGPGPGHRQRGSMDMQMRPGPPDAPPNGPSRVPDLHRTKSQPDMRQPQTAIFEMAGDVPPLPPNGPPTGGFQQHESPPSLRVGPGAPGGPGGPGGFGGLPGNPGPMKPPGPSPPPGNPDMLPSHPAPVRPGLMAGSMVSMGNKPAPVRNYNGTPPGMVPQPSPSQSSGPPPTQTPVTTDDLERLRMIVKADPNDQETGLRLARRLLEASDVLVPNVADPKTRQRARERYLVDAQKILKKLSHAQNPEAMFTYADCLGKGLFSHEPDNKEAFTLYQSAAKLGHAAAAYRTAVCCEIGQEEGGGTRKDPLKAIQWYKRAATLGDTPAMYKMGMIMLKGLLGQTKNPREAVGWLKRAAEKADGENPHALHELGLLYESAAPNDAIVRDEAYAFTLFKRAAELGYKFSQFRLGAAYEYGLMGCPIDPRLSIMWYSKAATQEEHQSELALSGWYLTGSEGVLGQSDTEAYLWARKAAMAGLAKAEYAMGYFTEVGIGVPANLDDAKRWYWRAAAQDFTKARERLEDLKRAGKNGPRQRERISRSKIGRQQEGECSVM